VRESRKSWLLLTVVLAFLLSACVTVNDRPADPDGADETPTIGNVTPTPGPTEPPPTPVPSGSFLRLDGIAAKQVVLWDSELPAEFAATRYTLYRRTDTRNWTRVGDLPSDGQLIADPSNPDLLYLGDHPPCLSEGEPISFYRSVDGGETWQEIEEATNIRPILVWPEDHDVIIGSRCGLAISQDAGLTWERHLPESGFDLTRLTVTQVGLFGIFTSESGVSNLRQIETEDLNNPVFKEPILSFWGTGAVHASQDRILVGEPGGVHFSDDGGRTWSSTREGLDDVVASVDPLEEDVPSTELEAGLGIFALLPHPENSSRIFLGTIRGLYLSEDSGQTWGQILEVEDRLVQRLNFSMGGAILYVTTDEGVIVIHNP
jgi:photosystem II stability/assembly factor-like uncharacterized protein